jgi:prepilin-type N-terminal cleavage/methylation domain-containing protein
MQRTSGFTLIELLVVISIMGMLAGIGLPTVMSSLTGARLGKAQGDIQDVASSARALTFTSITSTGKLRAFGIVVRQEPGQPITACVVWRGADDATGAHSDYELVIDPANGDMGIKKDHPTWKPYRRVRLAPDVKWILSGTSVTTTTEVAWYYQPRSGMTIAWPTTLTSGFPTTASPVNIGIRPPASDRLALNGVVMGIPDYDPTPKTLVAPGTDTNKYGFVLTIDKERTTALVGQAFGGLTWRKP